MHARGGHSLYILTINIHIPKYMPIRDHTRKQIQKQLHTHSAAYNTHPDTYSGKHEYMNSIQVTSPNLPRSSLANSLKLKSSTYIANPYTQKGCKQKSDQVAFPYLPRFSSAHFPKPRSFTFVANTCTRRKHPLHE